MQRDKLYGLPRTNFKRRKEKNENLSLRKEYHICKVEISVLKIFFILNTKKVEFIYIFYVY
jgi:hypothetical protein